MNPGSHDALEVSAAGRMGEDWANAALDRAVAGEPSTRGFERPRTIVEVLDTMIAMTTTWLQQIQDRDSVLWSLVDTCPVNLIYAVHVREGHIPQLLGVSNSCI